MLTTNLGRIVAAITMAGALAACAETEMVSDELPASEAKRAAYRCERDFNSEFSRNWFIAADQYSKCLRAHGLRQVSK